MLSLRTRRRRHKSTIWTVQGPSAYTGGLWITACEATAAMAEVMIKYHERLEQGEDVNSDLKLSESLKANLTILLNFINFRSFRGRNSGFKTMSLWF